MHVRRGIILFVLLTVAILVFLVHSVWILLTLLVVDGSEDAITKSELPSPDSDRIDTRPSLIPKIIHQTYKNSSIPLVWQDAQRSCRDLHRPEDGWEYKLWTDEIMDEFITQEYVWFWDTWESYKYPIQRADAIRYFALVHYGGVYIDLDDGCNRPLEPLLSYPAWVRKTVPTGISNDAMGAVPQHPFFKRVIDELQAYHRNWPLPYVTVMASTGPLFLSIIWRHYSAEGFNVGDEADGGRVRILFPEEYQGKRWSFFTHHLGNSWHGADVKLIFWMARNWVFVTVLGFVLGGTVIFAVWWLYRHFALRSRPPALSSPSIASSSNDLRPWKTSYRSRFPFWRRRSSRKDYELISRHDA